MAPNMEEQDVEAGAEEEVATDVADRLCKLMRRIQAAAEELTFPHPGNANSRISGLDRPLHEVFEPLAIELKFEDYAELRDNFVLLCNRVIRDIQSLSFTRPETQIRWTAAAKTANGVFNASNFGIDCRTVFSRHFSVSVFERLEDASERLQDKGRRETSEPHLREALEAARAAIEAYEVDGEMPPQVGRLLKHYMQQINSAYDRYRDFGEEAFWSTYKELFATFIQTHEVIMKDTKSEKVKSAMARMREKMAYGLPALSIASDVATIAATGIAVAQIAGF